MEMYKAAPNTSAVEKFGSRTGGFSEQTQKGQEEQGEEVTPTPNMGTRPPATAGATAFEQQRQRLHW